MLRLYRSTLSIAIGDSVKLASIKSRYSNCSKIFIGDVLYEIHSFLHVTVIVMDDSSNVLRTDQHWFVKCQPYVPHPCKPWFGYPTQVWNIGLREKFQFFLLNHITNRAVFTQSEVNFGSHWSTKYFSSGATPISYQSS